MIDFRRVQLYFSNIIAEIINSDDDIVNISFLIKKLSIYCMTLIFKWCTDSCQYLEGLILFGCLIHLRSGRGRFCHFLWWNWWRDQDDRIDLIYQFCAGMSQRILGNRNWSPHWQKEYRYLLRKCLCTPGIESLHSWNRDRFYRKIKISITSNYQLEYDLPASILLLHLWMNVEARVA